MVKLTIVTAIAALSLALDNAQATPIPVYHLSEGPGGLVTDIPGATIHQLGPDNWLVQPPQGEEWLGGPTIKWLPESVGDFVDRIGLPWPTGMTINGVPTISDLIWDSHIPAVVDDGEPMMLRLSLIPVGTIGDGITSAYVELTDTASRGGPPTTVPDGGSSGLLLLGGLGVGALFRKLT